MFFFWSAVLVGLVSGSSSLGNVFEGRARVEAVDESEALQSGRVGRVRLVAEQDLSPGRLASLPREELFGAEDAERILPFLSQYEELTKVQKVMLALMSGESPLSGVPINSPLLWSNAEVAELRATQIWKDLRRDIDGLKAASRSIMRKIVKEQGLSKELYNFKRWKRAYSVVKGYQLLSHLDQSFRLVPWIQLFSFARRGHAHLHETSEGNLEIWLRRPVKAGEEIVVNEDTDPVNDDADSDKEEDYSSNARLLHLYGIVVSRRMFGFTLSVGLDPDDSMYGNKRRMFDDRFGERSAPTQSFQLTGKLIPRDLIFALRVYNTDPIEAHELENAQRDERVGSANEKRVWEALGQLCFSKLQEYPTDMKEDREILEDLKTEWATSPSLALRNRKNAVLFRRAEKRVLTNTLREVDRQLLALHSNYMVRESDAIQLDKDADTGKTRLKVVDEL